MPGRDKDASPPSGDLQAAIRALRAEVLGLAASGRRPGSGGCSPPSPRAEPAGRPPARGAIPPDRPVLRIVRGAQDKTDAAPGAVDSAARAPLSRRGRRARRSTGPELPARERLIQLPEPALRRIAEEIRSSAALVGGWMELLGLGTLTPQEASTAHDRARLAQARVEAAVRQLEAAAGADREARE